MYDFAYLGRVAGHLSSDRCEVQLDLGFHVSTLRKFHLLESQSPFPVGSDVIASVARGENGQWVGVLRPGDDPDGLAMLWHYPAMLIKVVDGDTIDARVDIGCGIAVAERFRLADIAAPELFGVGRDEPGYARGVAARNFVQRRFTESGGAMSIHSFRRGKWRRWLAWVHMPDSGRSLNMELIEAGLAVFQSVGRRTGKPNTSSRITLNLEPDLHTRLTARAREMQQTPRTVVRTALTAFLRP
ncbi:MAG: thermonuclease family protein [Spirochaetaceae bacterium]|nr:thermonuclease family protein [Spirochaetaceae bacterium]